MNLIFYLLFFKLDKSVNVEFACASKVIYIKCDALFLEIQLELIVAFYNSIFFCHFHELKGFTYTSNKKQARKDGSANAHISAT